MESHLSGPTLETAGYNRWRIQTLPAFLPSAIFFFFTQNNIGGKGPPRSSPGSATDNNIP